MNFFEISSKVSIVQSYKNHPNNLILLFDIFFNKADKIVLDEEEVFYFLRFLKI
jgi:hypothetical protein